MKSWLEISSKSDFSIHNLPFGIFRHKKSIPHAGVAIGDYVIDLSVLFDQGSLKKEGIKKNVFEADALNDFISLGKDTGRKVRNRLIDLFGSDNSELRDNIDLKEKTLHKLKDVTMLLPVKPGNYTDFYSSLEHATNVGSMFRDPENPLLPNWKWLPVGYHGRASSIVVSGTPIQRPKGQIKLSENEPPVYAPTMALDFELEMAFITTNGKPLGQTILIEEAEEYIWGMVLFNDWSARDIQKWEYQPLGPFLGKSFASSVSPWVVFMDALEPFRVDGPGQNPPPLPYLRSAGMNNYDINLEVYLQPKGGKAVKICDTNFKYMYWNICQQLAHQSSNGCNIMAGDIYASGTISGPTSDSYGSMLELTWNGTMPFILPDGLERKFIDDGDTVIIKGYAGKNGIKISFGEVETTVLPAIL
ncbi:MAG: fumarylacetoacetase [Bacteroidetes bacterium]|nr:fumarylacetoacetase [Bacteroidota bacterium]